MPGPLHGLRVIEIAGIGPCPFAAMVFADMGAEVIRVERADLVGTVSERFARQELLQRGRPSVAVDLKRPDGVALVLELVERADALIEGFRPGVMERLGLGPDVCLERNPRLVYGRTTGWGQDGPYATLAGHDINFIALAGVLAHIARRDEVPLAPLNLVGDYGGGAMFLAFGVLAALHAAQASGRGQVVDAAMVDGSALMMMMHWMHKERGVIDPDHPGTSMLDSGAFFYETYRCRDGEHITVGTIERNFYLELIRLVGLGDDPLFAARGDREGWPERKRRFAELFATRTRDEWCEILSGTDACFAPVLRMDEAATHPHNVARGTFIEIDGVVQPAPAPRFSDSVPDVPTVADLPGEHSIEALAEWGIEPDRVDALLSSGAVVDAAGRRAS